MKIKLKRYPVFIGEDALLQLEKFIFQKQYSSVFLLMDKNTNKHCYPLVKKFIPPHRTILISPGEENKKIETCCTIWTDLSNNHADRKSVLINLGGGVIGDIGGFCAGLFMRGIDFIQLPTSLLAQVDASVGGKTGIDFGYKKNMIGLFNDPQAVFIYPDFLKTLSPREILSGFAEIIKHHLIADKKGFEKLIELKEIKNDWQKLILHSVKIKSKITESDPFENGIRKALNFGHTIGHAIESSFLQEGVKPLLHGEAVAAGIVCESFISAEKNLITKKELNKIISLIKKNYVLPVLDEKRMDSVIEFVSSDKKNEFKKFNCTLLNGIGNTTINQEINKEDIFLSMRFYNSFIQSKLSEQQYTH